MKIKTYCLSFCTGSLLLCFSTCEFASSNEDIPNNVLWEIRNVNSDVDNGIQILLYHDMEGLSGQDEPNSLFYGEPEYLYGQELLAADVNAVVDGLFAGGATEVHIVDGHGSGNSEPDLITELLDPRAKQVFRDSAFNSYVDLVESGIYDAVGVVGMHAKTGSRGFVSHTLTFGMEVILNGQSITETELVALSWGRADVPVIFASGDDRLENDLKTMPWIEYVQVKKATSASTVDLRPVDEARRDLTEGAKRAVQNLASSKIMKLQLPVKATLKAHNPAGLKEFEGIPVLEYSDNSVSFRAESFMEAYVGLSALVNVARKDYRSIILFDVVAARPDGMEVIQIYYDSITNRWLDVESGRWQKPPPSAPVKHRYHGFN